MGDGLAKSTSLITLNLTINSSNLDITEHCTKGLVDVLAKNASLTTVNLTINSSDCDMTEQCSKGLGDFLRKARH